MPRVIRPFTALTIKVFAVVAVAAVAGGCMSPPPRLNAPPQGWSSRQADMQQHYTYMTDNAMLAEMDVTDVHFVPHTGDLNSLGARRLDRYAALLKESGGQLKYDTELKDTKLIQQRLASMKKYLAAAGADSTKLIVAQGPVGVEGMSAEEAITVRDKFVGGGDQSGQSGGLGGTKSGSGSGSGMSGGSQ